jgi:hypothetical protein
MATSQIVGVFVDSNGITCLSTTREWEPENGVDPVKIGIAPNLKLEGSNLELSLERQLYLDLQFRRFPKVDLVLVIGDAPDRDYVAKYLDSRFSGKVALATGIAFGDKDIFRALDAKFYELTVLEVENEWLEDDEDFLESPAKGKPPKKSKRPREAKK